MKKFFFILLCSVATAAGPIIDPYRFAASGGAAGPWAHVQSTGNNSDSDASTIVKAYAGNVTAANFLVCFVGWYSNGGETISGVADSLSQTWTQAGSSRTVAGIGGNWSCAMFYFPNTAGGANTVTATFSPTAQFRSISISEYSGIKTSSPLDATTGQVQTDPGFGTDAITSGNITTSVANTLIYGGALVASGGDSLAAGTNFTSRDTRNTSYTRVLVEDKTRSLATAGSHAATITHSFDATADSATIVAAFKEP